MKEHISRPQSQKNRWGVRRAHNTSAIARAAGLDPSQLYGWRRKALASEMVAPLWKHPIKTWGLRVSSLLLFRLSKSSSRRRGARDNE
jgi:transposase-like protein